MRAQSRDIFGQHRRKVGVHSGGIAAGREAYFRIHLMGTGDAFEARALRPFRSQAFMGRKGIPMQ
jgi:hypothetical protein